MPAETEGRHTTESVEQVALRLERIAKDLRISGALIGVETPPQITVLKQNSLNVGLARLQAWADSLRDAVDDSRLLAAQNGGVSASDTAPEKPSKTSTQKSTIATQADTPGKRKRRGKNLGEGG